MKTIQYLLIGIGLGALFGFVFHFIPTPSENSNVTKWPTEKLSIVKPYEAGGHNTPTRFVVKDVELSVAGMQRLTILILQPGENPNYREIGTISAFAPAGVKFEKDEDVNVWEVDYRSITYQTTDVLLAEKLSAK